MKLCSHICPFLYLTTVELQNENKYEVSKHHEVNCTLHTSQPVNSSDVNISWTGPNVRTNESNRITVLPAYYNGYIHTSALQFSYISEDDNNTSYNCTAFLSAGNETSSYHISFTISELTSKLS